MSATADIGHVAQAIVAVEDEIKKVEIKIEVVEEQIKSESDVDEKKALREEKKALREKEKALREEKKALREKEMFLLKGPGVAELMERLSLAEKRTDVILLANDFVDALRANATEAAANAVAAIGERVQACLSMYNKEDRARYTRYISVAASSTASTTSDVAVNEQATVAWVQQPKELEDLRDDEKKLCTTSLSSLRVGAFEWQAFDGTMWDVPANAAAALDADKTLFVESLKVLSQLAELMALRMEGSKMGGYERALQTASEAVLSLACSHFAFTLKDATGGPTLWCPSLKLKGRTDMLVLDTATERIALHIEMKTAGVVGPAQSQLLGQNVCLAAGLNNGWNLQDWPDDAGAPVGVLFNGVAMWRCCLLKVECGVPKFAGDHPGPLSGDKMAESLWETFECVRAWISAAEADAAGEPSPRSQPPSPTKRARGGGRQGSGGGGGGGGGTTAAAAGPAVPGGGANKGNNGGEKRAPLAAVSVSALNARNLLLHNILGE